MTTAVKTDSFQAKVAEAQQELRTIERKLEESQDDVNRLYAAKAPPEEVKALESEIAGLFKAAKAAKAELAEAKQDLRRGQREHAEKLAAQFVETMWQRAHALHQAQLDLIALIRTMQNLGFDSRETGPIAPVYLLYAEITSGLHGESMKRDKKAWPLMGDRRTSNEMIAGQMAALRGELEAL